MNPHFHIGGLIANGWGVNQFDRLHADVVRFIAADIENRDVRRAGAGAAGLPRLAKRRVHTMPAMGLAIADEVNLAVQPLITVQQIGLRG